MTCKPAVKDGADFFFPGKLHCASSEKNHSHVRVHFGKGFNQFVEGRRESHVAAVKSLGLIGIRQSHEDKDGLCAGCLFYRALKTFFYNLSAQGNRLFVNGAGTEIKELRKFCRVDFAGARSLIAYVFCHGTANQNIVKGGERKKLGLVFQKHKPLFRDFSCKLVMLILIEVPCVRRGNQCVSLKNKIQNPSYALVQILLAEFFTADIFACFLFLMS